MTSHVAVLVHICDRITWAAATRAGSYAPPSLAEEGFIHLSSPAQVLVPANERYVGRTDLVLLVIDPSRLTSEVIWEDCYESGLEFPHLYAELSPAAVINVVDFPCTSDGTFLLPSELSS